MVVTVEILWTSILARRARGDKSPDWSDVELHLVRPIRVEPKRTDVLFVNLESSMTRGFDHSQRFMANSHQITGNNRSEKLTGFRRFQTDFSSSLLLVCCNQQQKWSERLFSGSLVDIVYFVGHYEFWVSKKHFKVGQRVTMLLWRDFSWIRFISEHAN